MPSPFSRPFSIAVLVCAALLAACSSPSLLSRIDSRVEGSFDASVVGGYAWLSDLGIEPRGDQLPAERNAEARRRIDEALQARGFQKVRPGEAACFVTYDASIDTRRRRNDPYFSVYTQEEVEELTLGLELLDRTRLEAMWRAEATTQLRRTAATSGPFATELEGVDLEREWRVDEMLEVVFDLLDDAMAGS